MTARIGLSLAPSKQISSDDVIALVEIAEAEGYESVWIPETWGVDAVSLLGTLAGKTSRIKLAAGVLNIYSRSAALIAQTAAGLQTLSHGRFVLGLGTSGPGVVEPWHGVPFRRPLPRTRAYVEAIRLALSGQQVNVDGPDFHLRGFRLAAVPPVRVSIYIAAIGHDNVCLTGEIADGWLPIFAARGLMGPLFDRLTGGVEQAGRDPAEIDVAAYLPVLLGPSGPGLLRAQLAYYIGGMGRFYSDFLSAAGFEGAVSEIRQRWQAGNRVAAAQAVDDRLVDLCTLGCGAMSARTRLDQYRSEGIRLPIITLPQGSSIAEAERTIRDLSPER